MADNNTTASIVQHHSDINGTEHKIGLPHQQDQNQYQHPQHARDIAGTTSRIHGVGAGLYQCADCQRRYSRPEHLARHVQTHTLGKRFSCPECNKAFARADLLKRHAANHTADALGLKRRKWSGNSLGRVSHACSACATARVKCEELKPCSRCRLRNIACEYASSEAGSAAAMHLLHLSAHTTVYGEQNQPSLPQPLAFSTTESSSLLQPCGLSMGSETQMASPDTIGHCKYNPVKPCTLLPSDLWEHRGEV
jgi:Fungal Zn(2)-Cys(6) binuclear cluster domain/Zinc finger, C2H2 type